MVGGGVLRSLTCLLAVGGAVAQDLSVPAAWGSKANITDARALREGYANDAAAELEKNIAPNGAFSSLTESQALATFYTGLSMQDYLSGNQTWKDAVVNNMKTWTGQIDIYGNGTAGSPRTNTNGMQWALAAFYAYKAYGDQQLLTLAKNSFDQTYNGNYITPAVAAAKQGGPGRNISYNASACFANTGGAIFLLPDVPNNSQINADAVGPFSILAGLLFEETGNTTYKTLALQSAQYLAGLGFDARTGYDQEIGQYDVSSCGFNVGQSPGLQGWMIHALSIATNQTTDASVQPGLFAQLRVALSAAGNNTAYTDSSGYFKDTTTNISSDEFADKAILVRALSETIRRFPASQELVAYSKALLSVQYNTLLGNAKSGNTYSSSLIGPPPPTFEPSGNIVAVTILNAAFSVAPKDAASNTTSGANPSGTSSPNSAGPNSGSTSSSSSSPAGAIAGGVVGGIAVIAAIVGFLFWRRRKSRRSSPMREPFDGDRMGGSPGPQPPFAGHGAPNPEQHAMSYMVEPFTAGAATLTRPGEPGSMRHQPAHAMNSPFADPMHSPQYSDANSNPMSSPHYNDSRTTALSGIQPASTAPTHSTSAESAPAPMRATNGVEQLPAGYSAKLARMNAPPPPTIPRGAAAPSPPAPASDVSSGGGSGQQDIPALVNQLVSDLLREHGTVPPSYEER